MNLCIEPEPFHRISYMTSAAKQTGQRRWLPFIRVKTRLPASCPCLVATSDLQGRERKNGRLLGEVVAEQLLQLVRNNVIPPVTLALLCGDLYDYPTLHKMGGSGDVAPVWQAFCQQVAEVVGVHGNHDMLADQDIPVNGTILDGNQLATQGLTIGGVSGICGKTGKNQRKTPEQFDKALHDALTSNTDVLLLHQGPSGDEPERRGDGATRDFLLSRGRALVLFGHCYWRDPFTIIGDNLCLNTDGRVWVIEHADL